MDILFYCCRTKGPGERLHHMIKMLHPKKKVETIREIAGLTRRLCVFKSDIAIVILFITSAEELSNLYAFREFFLDLRIILILPDHEKFTIKLGHAMLPRFVSFADADLFDVVAVLDKMVCAGAAPPG